MTKLKFKLVDAEPITHSRTGVELKIKHPIKHWRAEWIDPSKDRYKRDEAGKLRRVK